MDSLIIAGFMSGTSMDALDCCIAKISINPDEILNYKIIAGVDEAGRGPWAGPVYSAAVILNHNNIPEEIHVGGSLINLKKLNIKKNNQIKKINPQEKKVLEKMLSSPGKVFSRNDIGKIINISKERTIDVMITRLRQKIESDPKNPKYLQTIRGSGYVLWIE